MRKIFIFLIVIFNVPIAYAYCTDSRIEDIYRKIHPTSLLNRDLLDCKKKPDTNETIFVFAQRHNDVDKDGYYAIDIDILAVNNSTNQIIAHTFFPKLWKDEDTNTVGSITIDTAKYYLTKDIRAFGVSANFTGASHADPADYTLLSLFIFQQDKIKPVLKDLQISSYSGEWDTRCAGTFTDEKTVLSMLPMSLNGYFDIGLKKTIKHTETKEVKGDCQEFNEKSFIKNSLLKFNGFSYKLY